MLFAERSARARSSDRCRRYAVLAGAVSTGDGSGRSPDSNAAESRSQARAYGLRDSRSRRIRTWPVRGGRTFVSFVAGDSGRRRRPTLQRSTTSCWRRSTNKARRPSRAARPTKRCATTCVLLTDAPGSELAAKGHNDAIAVVEGQRQLEGSRDLLQDFALEVSGQSATAPTSTKRLAGLYEKSESWNEAARRVSTHGRC